jgi:hypothetical protein
MWVGFIQILYYFIFKYLFNCSIVIVHVRGVQCSTSIPMHNVMCIGSFIISNIYCVFVLVTFKIFSSNYFKIFN